MCEFRETTFWLCLTVYIHDAMCCPKSGADSIKCQNCALRGYSWFSAAPSLESLEQPFYSLEQIQPSGIQHADDCCSQDAGCSTHPEYD